MSSKQFSHLILCIEAVMIIIGFAIGGNVIIGMICYWAVVAVYHLTDFLIARKDERRRKEETDGRE